jgi:hypothetical protein
MLKTYCSECGAPTEYSLNKPKFCSSCGNSFDKKTAVPVLKPKRTISKIQEPIDEIEDMDDIDGGEDVDHVPDIQKIDYELSLPPKNKETIGNLAGTSTDSSEENWPKIKVPKLSKKEFLDNFAKEAGSLRGKPRKKHGPKN